MDYSISHYIPLEIFLVVQKVQEIEMEILKSILIIILEQQIFVLSGAVKPSRRQQCRLCAVDNAAGPLLDISK